MHTVTLDGVEIAYINQSDLARALGISRHLLAVWPRRYKDFPVIERDGTVRGAPLYRADRLDEIVATIRAWDVNRPGQGTGGGRPRKNPTKESSEP